MKTYTGKKRRIIQRELASAVSIQGASMLGQLYLKPMEGDLEPLTLVVAPNYYMENNMEICHAILQSLREVMLKHNINLTGNVSFQLNHASFNSTFDNISWDEELVATAPEGAKLPGLPNGL